MLRSTTKLASNKSMFRVAGALSGCKSGIVKNSSVAGFKYRSVLNKPMGESLYHDQMHQQWMSDPFSVDEAWRNHFENGTGLTDIDSIMDQLSARGIMPGSGEQTATSGDMNKAQSDSFKVFQFIRAYMTHGHFKADLDPLNMEETYGELGVAQKF
jgi:2-oxoglutarate dehydrogenase complex dehydrogenase (E1) component-like enzyme